MPWTDGEKKAMPAAKPQPAAKAEPEAAPAPPAPAPPAAPESAKKRDNNLVPMYKVEADGTRTEDDIHYLVVEAHEADGWKRKEE